jgi:hypothetical protein
VAAEPRDRRIGLAFAIDRARRQPVRRKPRR